MREFLTADDIYALILSIRSVRSTSILLVEGDSDAIALDAHLSETHAESLPAHGKLNVLGAVEIAREQGADSVVGLVDRDFVGILRPRYEESDIVTTSYYDLEADILNLDGVCSHLARVCGGRAISDYVSSILDQVVRAVTPIAVLRLLVERDGLPVSVQNIPAHEVIEPTSRECNINKLMAIVGARAGLQHSVRDSLRDRLEEELRIFSHPPKFIVSGHDMVGALCFLIKVGSGKKIGVKEMATHLRVALTFERLRKLELYAELQSWADANGAIIWKPT